MKVQQYYLLLSIFFSLQFLTSCENNVFEASKGDAVSKSYAENFSINKIDNGYIINIYENNNTHQYLLNSSENLKQNGQRIINIPVERVVCFSSTHCAFISTLGKEESIKGVSGKKYIYNSKIKNNINKDKVYEIGHESRINYEKIISIEPDVVFAFSIDNRDKAALQKLEGFNIPVIFIKEFTEPDVLGRTEWLKLFACFYDKLDFATEYCDSVFYNYNQLKKRAEKAEIKPKVLTGMPYEGIWWVPGGNSYFAQLIEHAGGEYIFKTNDKTESIPINIENVFAESKNVDIWLNPNLYSSKNEMLRSENRIKHLHPFNNALIYNNNKRMNKNKGNDFWESGIVHPDKILKDLYNIFHKDSPDNLHYYRRVY